MVFSMRWLSIIPYSDSEIKDQFQANFFGPISLMQALLPSFREREAGHILNISSIAGFAGGPGCGAYNASKAALEHFSDALSTEVQRKSSFQPHTPGCS